MAIFSSARMSTFGLGRLVALLILLLGVLAASANAQTNSTWNGGTGNWSNLSDWNPAAVPNNSGSTTYDVTIGVANSNVTMDALNDTINNLTLEATSSLTITGNTLNLVTGASFDNGTITNTGDIFNNDLGASLTVSGEIVNQASFISGTFAAPALNNAGKLFVTAGGMLLNLDGNINNSGMLTNSGNVFMQQGFINNFGTLANNSDGTLTFEDASVINSGKFYNYGTVQNHGGIFNNLGASLTNYGTIDVYIGAAIINHGTLLNTAAGTINNFGTGQLFNYGTLNNAGTINNSASELYNYGTLNNSGILLNIAEGDNPDSLFARLRSPLCEARVNLQVQSTSIASERHLDLGVQRALGELLEIGSKAQSGEKLRKRDFPFWLRLPDRLLGVTARREVIPDTASNGCFVRII